MQKTNIGWCDYSSNPLYAVDKATRKRGWFCTRVSEGCKNCYAAAINKRFGNGFDYAKTNEGKIEFQVNAKELSAIERFNQPKVIMQMRGPDFFEEVPPVKIFLCDMTDLFHEMVSYPLIGQVFESIENCWWHVFQILTKRPDRMAAYTRRNWLPAYQPQFIWLGTSCENQKTADERIPILREVPAAVRFLSVEPLLEPIELDLTGIQWVIVGGESGPNRRPMEIAWLRSIVEQCSIAGVPVWVKQDSAFRPGTQGRIPDELWIHEFPAEREEASAR